MKAAIDKQLNFCSSFCNKGYYLYLVRFSLMLLRVVHCFELFVNLQLQNIARERDERKRRFKRFYESYFSVSVYRRVNKDERATRIL